MSKLKLAIIGVGHLGSRHLKVFDGLRDGVEIVAVCDIKNDPLKLLANDYRVPAFNDYTQINTKLDAVSICVPTELHFKVAEHFLNRGVHTFIEKPMTKTLLEAESLNNLARAKNLKLQIGHVERFNAGFQSVKHFTTQPLFIECHRLNPFPNRSLDIGVVMDLMIHDIDIILGLIPSPVKDIQAVGVNVLTPLEDIANVRITFANGCVCNLTASRVSQEVMRKIRLFQKDTYISLDYVKQEAFIYKKCDAQILKHSLPIEKEEPLKKELAHFIECVREDKQPLVSGEDGQKALELALDITAKINQQRKDSERFYTETNPIPAHVS